MAIWVVLVIGAAPLAGALSGSPEQPVSTVVATAVKTTAADATRRMRGVREGGNCTSPTVTFAARG